MTYSVVARDPDTGELAVAAQSHYFAVGSIVGWAEAGVGAVATQAMAEPSYGPLGLDRLRDGEIPDLALRALVAADPGGPVRQVAMVDAAGRVAAHTGERCIHAAQHVTGDGWSVQGNMLVAPDPVDAMAVAMRASEGLPLVGRVLRALDAAEAAGGDIRGRQSASLLVVSGERGAGPWAGRTIDVRVDDHPDPLAELGRIAGFAAAYRAHPDPDPDAAPGAPPAPEALESAEELLAAIGGNPELAFWRGVELASSGRDDEAVAFLRSAFAVSPGWRELLLRLPAAGLIEQRHADAVLGRLA